MERTKPQIHTEYRLRTANRSSWQRGFHGVGYGDMRGSSMINVAPSRSRSIIKNNMNSGVSSKVYNKLYEKSKAKSFLNKQGASSLVLDAFNHWNCKTKDYKITPDKYWWHNLLTKVDNHLLQYATNGKAGYSYMAAQHTMGVIDKLYAKYGDDLDKHLDKLNDGIKNGDVEGDKEFKKSFESAINSAKNKIKKDLDNMENSGNEAGKGNDEAAIDTVDLLTDPRLAKLLTIKESNIRDFLRTTIDKATESVTGKSYIEEESLFDSEDIEDLINIENFAHVALFEDLTTRIKKYSISFDIYIDDSGSMDSTIFMGDTRVCIRNLSRLLAFKLKELDILRDCYLFSHSDTLTKINNNDLFSAHIGGGTDIEQCITNAKLTKRPAIIITDGWDRIDPETDYHADKFFLVLGEREMPSCFKKFAVNKQLMFFTGGKFFKGIYDKENETVKAA